jgi:hypothetical protein
VTHPAPLVRARPAFDVEIPRTCRTLMATAEATGWQAEASYAHGTSITAQGQPGRLVESVVLRLWWGDHRLVATWHDGKFKSGWAHIPGYNAVRVGARDLGEIVKEAP